MINVGPGQRETIRGGRDQDLLTPFWQRVTLCVEGAWILAWLVAMALVVGPLLGYVVSWIALSIRWRFLRKRFTVIPWQWLAVNVTTHTLAAYGADVIWTPYLLPWSPWLKMLWSALCAVMIAPAALMAYVIAVRLLDPNYPSPRKAVDQRQPQMPWHVDEPAGPIAMPDREEIRVRIEDHTTTATAYPDRDMCDLFSPVGHPGNLARYAAALIRGNETSAAFSFAGGNDHHGASHWRYTRAEFGELSTEAARAGLVYREKKNQPYTITDRGRFTFGRIAERGLDHSSHSPAPGAQS